MTRQLNKTIFESSLVVFSALLLFSISTDSMAEEYYNWRLANISYKQIEPFTSKLWVLGRHEANSRGGFVEMTALPEPGCDRGPQRFRFSWSFDRDITQLSGKKGDYVFTVYPKIEGDKGGGCLDLNPFYYPAGLNDFLTRNIGGEGRYYFKYIDATSQPPQFLFYINPVALPYPGEYRVTILGGGWKWGGGQLAITYHYEQVSGQPPDDRKARCDQYAKTAVAQNNENLSRRCGYSGGRWQSNYDNHFGWCMNVDRGVADSETRIRDEELRTCGTGDKRAFCDQYAKTAINQNGENIRRNCGYTGGRWQSNYDNHYGWCMNVDRGVADSETRIRDEELRTCGKSNVFYNPTHQGYRIDRCLYWGEQCDQAAADHFCRSKGFAGAASWRWEHVKPTIILGDGQICNADFCGGFSLIECIQIIR